MKGFGCRALGFHGLRGARLGVVVGGLGGFRL